MKAVYNGITLAESNDTIFLEGNEYFPPESIKRDFLFDTSFHTSCPWKGMASYYGVNMDGIKIDDIAWYYPNPSIRVQEIKNYVAFDYRVKIIK